jgi:hypothetical protein
MLARALKELKAMPAKVECMMGTPDAIEEYHYVATRLRDLDTEQLQVVGPCRM